MAIPNIYGNFIFGVVVVEFATSAVVMILTRKCIEFLKLSILLARYSRSIVVAVIVALHLK